MHQFFAIPVRMVSTCLIVTTTGIASAQELPPPRKVPADTGPVQEAGAEVIAVGAKAGETYTSKLGYPIKSQKSFDEIGAADFDGVVVPGGYAPDLIRRHSAAARAMHAG